MAPEFEDRPAPEIDAERLREELAREMRALARRSRSVYETRLRLEERELPSDLAEMVIAALQRYGFLDDQRFAGEYVRSKLRTGFGPDRIRAELHERGVAESLIDATLAAEEEETPQVDLLRDVLEKRLRVKGEPRSRKDLKNLMDFLIRRGFAPERVRSALDRHFRALFR